MSKVRVGMLFHNYHDRSIFIKGIQLEYRLLGSQGLSVTRIGLGCMGMSEFYGSYPESESVDAIHAALDLGVNFFDTADIYGPFTNEVLVGQALKHVRDRVCIATKIGIVRKLEDPNYRGICGRPDYVDAAVKASLKRLGTSYIDLLYIHRIDRSVPIEETIGAMSRLVQDGLVRCIGLCEASVDTLQRAHAVHKLTALQSEYSLWSRDPENGTLAACEQLGIGFVAYSPLGRGFLTGTFNGPKDFQTGDWRCDSPRFVDQTFYHNRRLVQCIERVATVRGASSAQVALAWVMSKSNNIVPIPGTRRRLRVKENVDASNLQLSSDEIGQLEETFSQRNILGDRYSAGAMQFLNL